MTGFINWTLGQERQVMRALILAATILGILACANAAKAGPSTTPRELASLDTAAVSDEATPETEDQIGLTRITRREVQRRLITLGFDTRVSGKFEESTRAAIARWQEERGYPKTGFLNTAQHTALLESGSAGEAGKSNDQDHHRHGARAHRPRGIGGPIGAIGGAIGGLFR
jgi:peptidoglycan hydrolase-like protein with peptidoglycan-binding domain